MDSACIVEQTAWKIVMEAICEVVRKFPRPGRKCRYSDTQILAMYFWAVKHNQSLSWACHRLHYGMLLRPRKLPSISQFTRRVADAHTQSLLQEVHNRLADRQQPCDGGILDGKSLPVSPVSKDPDARKGYAGGGFAKGYKLHAFVNRNRRIVVWSVMPLNYGEQPVALELLPYLPPLLPTAVNLADGNYDSVKLYKAHGQMGAVLFTPLRGQEQRQGKPRNPVNLRAMGPQRREAVEAWDKHPDLARFVMEERNSIENIFSVLTVGVGLLLPPSVRRLGRVRRFVGAKIILYHARLIAQERAARMAA